MLKHGKFIVVIAALLVGAAMVGTTRPKWPRGLKMSVKTYAASQPDPQKTTGPPAAAPNSNSEVFVDDYTKKLLLMMDTNKSGKVSKKEFMSFMSKEFDRLDTNHDGELDVYELAKWQVHPYVGK